MSAVKPLITESGWSKHDEILMDIALEEARLALTHGDVPVGAVIVDAEGTVLARTHNRKEEWGDPTAHAEVLAIREAARRTDRVVGPSDLLRTAQDSERGILRDEVGKEAGGNVWYADGCTLYVTLEPCPMCAGAIVHSRFPRIVIGAWDQKTGATGSLYDIVRDRRLNNWTEVVSGVQAEESAQLLQSFFTLKRK